MPSPERIQRATRRVERASRRRAQRKGGPATPTVSRTDRLGGTCARRRRGVWRPFDAAARRCSSGSTRWRSTTTCRTKTRCSTQSSRRSWPTSTSPPTIPRRIPKNASCGPRAPIATQCSRTRMRCRSCSRGDPAPPLAMRPVELLIGILRDAGLPAVTGDGGDECDRCHGPRHDRDGRRSIRAKPPRPRSSSSSRTSSRPRSFRTCERSSMCPADFLNEDFEFGVRALARGLLGSVEAGAEPLA